MRRLLMNNRKVGSLVMMVAALLVMALAPPGCGSTPAEPCVGGFLRGEVCEAKCDAASCLENNVCVDNRCSLKCDSHDQCFFAVQECTQAKIDDTEIDVIVCLSNDRRPVPDANGFPAGTYGFGCPFGDVQCVATACPNGLECDLAACADCALDAAACSDKEHCNIGKCAASGEACTFNTCAPAECKKMQCITAGEGDAEAYCTANDCGENSDCPGGFYCGVTRDARTACGRTCDNNVCSHDGSACQGASQCEKGAGLCGDTAEPCLDEAALSANGATFFDGALCLLRQTCLVADECAPCTANVDCSLGSGVVCAANGSDNVCARFCDDDSNCPNDKGCSFYGKTCQDAPGTDCASADDCPGGSPCVDRSVCLPKNGSACQATPDTPNFCHPCLSDADCGGPGGFVVCADVNDGEKACFDFSFGVSCTNDSDCPTAPGGANGECLDEAEGVDPGNGVYHTCYFPFSDAESSFTCHP